jgi:DNA-binding CsgD family transcriptional regulator
LGTKSPIADFGARRASRVYERPPIQFSFDIAADLIAAVGCSSFSDTLMRIGKNVMDADYCTLFAFSASREPVCLVATGVEFPDAALRASQQYLHRHWRSDPLLQDSTPDDRKVHHVFSSEFTDTYRRECYDIPQISDRLTMLFREGPTTFRMSFYRYRKRCIFSEADSERLRVAARMLHEAAKRHFALSNGFGVDPSTGRPSLQLMAERLAGSGAGLSDREVEVCARILIGMSTEGISSDLDIGLTSVVTYRKRAYAKLGTGNQNELFARFLVN